MPKWKLILPTGVLWLVAVFWGSYIVLESPGRAAKQYQNLPAAQLTLPEKPTLLMMLDPRLSGCAGIPGEAEHVRN